MKLCNVLDYIHYVNKFYVMWFTQAPTVTVSQKGKQKLLLHGYQYTVHSMKADGSIRWRCAERSMHCYGSLSTDALGRQVIDSKPHTHAANDAQCEITLAYNDMKSRAAHSWDKPGLIFAQGVHTMSAEARAEIRSSSAIKRTLRNCRTSAHPRVPACLDDLVIDGVWRTCGNDNRPFLVSDNGPGSRIRLIVFATDQCLEVLAASSTWYMDGNFAMAPTHFLQVGGRHLSKGKCAL